MSRKKVEKIEKRINQTVHQLAMTRPEVREALEALRACWSDLSPLQRGEQLNVLIGFKCSAGGSPRIRETGDEDPQVHRASQSAGTFDRNDGAHVGPGMPKSKAH